MRKRRTGIARRSALAPFIGLAAALICAAAFGASETSEIPLTTKTVSATIYADRAEVARSGRVELRAGLSRLVCDDLPQRFDDASLRVEGSGTAEARILGIDIVTLRGRLADSPRYRELKDRLEKLIGKQDTLKIELEGYAGSLVYLDNLAKFPFEKGSSKLATEIFRVADWKGVIEFIAGERVKTNEKIAAHNKRAAKLNEEIAWVEKQIQEMQMRDDWSKRVVIDLEARTAGLLDVDLVYNVSGATWSPEYTIRYRPAEGTIALGYNASIRQSTGEDWSSVAVALSTARPQIGAAPPEIQPYYIARRLPRPRTTSLEVREAGALEKKAQYDIGLAASEPVKAEHLGAVLESTPFAATFSIPKKIDLPSGADPRRALILEGSLVGTLSRYAAPRLSQNVFVRGTVANTLDVPLLPGSADVYIETGDGTARRSIFVGKETLSGIATGQEFPISLGADQDFKISQKLEKKEYLSKEGAATKKIRYHYVISLENFKKEKLAVKLQDRVPVSTLKEVRVTSVDLEPRPSEELETGIVTWNLEPAPKEKIEIRIAYTIEFPGDWDERSLNLE